MVDLKVVRLSDRIVNDGRLFDCTMAKGKNEYL